MGINKKMLSTNFIWRIEKCFTVSGRVMAFGRTISNYVICVTYATMHGPNLLLIIATRHDGTFTVGGIPAAHNSSTPVEFCVFGDFTQQDARGHLETKRLDPGQPGETLDFGDLQLSPVTDLNLRFTLEDGPIEDPSAHMYVLLIPTCRIVRADIPADGRVLLKNFPREPVRFLVQAGEGVYCDPTNPLQPHANDRGFYLRPGDASELEVRLKRRPTTKIPDN